jgi:hypothetical protein
LFGSWKADRFGVPVWMFGGVRGSGFGRFAGRAALEEFTELRWITVGGPEGRRPNLEHRTAFWDKRRSALPPQYPTP